MDGDGLEWIGLDWTGRSDGIALVRIGLNSIGPDVGLDRIGLGWIGLDILLGFDQSEDASASIGLVGFACIG